MNIQSAKVELVGGPFDGENIATVTNGPSLTLSLPSGTMVYYLLYKGKYHFDKYLTLKQQKD